MNQEESRKRLRPALFLILFALSAMACGGSVTTFVSSYRPPKAEPLAMRGEKVAAVVMMKNEIIRRQAEDVLAREITHYGAKGIAMYRLSELPPAENEAAARKAIEAEGIKGVVVMRPTGTKTRTETNTYSNWSDPYYSGYWGGYYGYGWASPYGYGSARGALVAGPGPVIVSASPGSSTETVTTTEQVVEVEVMVYSLKQNALVWAGVSHTTEPTKVDEFVIQLAAATVKELGGQGLLSSE
jgi:hypothetical protein